ncbi:SOS response-associated peptidase [Paenibacillus thalictri]|uniref:Abasic site processing protein n=1 Tax=Paenibacillus thalictri TaxID=2527873 RepID=A0A4Q9DR93_9BACL|nr:SOS response-associated peptidase [Paenibacillus thalictri]TBL77667.1 SOS response-associated peptidase [Paenibacillus thalictri]
MCGRYTITLTLEEMMLRFLLDDSFPAYHTPKYNVAPGQMVLAIIHDGEKNRLGELKWGLVPSWSKDDKSGARMMNARAETIADKPAYRLPFQRKRCLIPADGFYEWKRTGKDKQPMRIVLKDEGLFAMAGLYDTWIAPDGSKLSTCTIITVPSNGLMAGIHDRMPAILRREDEQVWLDRRNQDSKLLQSLLKPYPEELMRAYPVSSLVGSVRNDTPECIREVAAAAETSEHDIPYLF